MTRIGLCYASLDAWHTVHPVTFVLAQSSRLMLLRIQKK